MIFNREYMYKSRSKGGHYGPPIPKVDNPAYFGALGSFISSSY